MRLHTVLSLTMALCMVILFPGGLGLFNHHHCITAGREDFAENLKHLPLVPETWVAEWSSSIGLRSPHGRVRFKMAVIPESQQQQPIVAESMVAEWSSSIGLSRPHSIVRFRMALIPEGWKQLHVIAESITAEWSSSIGLHSLHGRIRFRAGVIPEGLNIMAPQLPCSLGQQGKMTWLLSRPWITVWQLSMAGILLGLCRNVRHKGQPCCFQGRREMDSYLMGTRCRKKRSLRYRRLLCQLKTANRVMLRYLRHVSHQYQKAIEYNHLKEEA